MLLRGPDEPDHGQGESGETYLPVESLEPLTRVEPGQPDMHWSEKLPPEELAAHRARLAAIADEHRAPQRWEDESEIRADEASLIAEALRQNGWPDAAEYVHRIFAARRDA